MVEGFKNTEVGTIPIDWKVKNIVENSTMKARIGWQGLTVSEYLDKGDYFLITGTDFVEGKIKWDTCHFVDKSRYDQDKNIQIKEGDILITKDGTIGKIAFVDDLTLPATLNSGIFVIRPKKNDNYLPKFLFYIFNSFYFNDFLTQIMH
jgi:type I restriction enzyme S subunit